MSWQHLHQPCVAGWVSYSQFLTVCFECLSVSLCARPLCVSICVTDSESSQPSPLSVSRLRHPRTVAASSAHTIASKPTQGARGCTRVQCILQVGCGTPPQPLGATPVRTSHPGAHTAPPPGADTEVLAAGGRCVKRPRGPAHQVRHQPGVGEHRRAGAGGPTSADVTSNSASSSSRYSPSSLAARFRRAGCETRRPPLRPPAAAAAAIAAAAAAAAAAAGAPEPAAPPCPSAPRGGRDRAAAASAPGCRGGPPACQARLRHGEYGA